MSTSRIDRASVRRRACNLNPDGRQHALALLLPLRVSERPPGPVFINTPDRTDADGNTIPDGNGTETVRNRTANRTQPDTESRSVRWANRTRPDQLHAMPDRVQGRRNGFAPPFEAGPSTTPPTCGSAESRNTARQCPGKRGYKGAHDMTKAANQTALPPLSEHGASLSLLPPDPALRVTQAEFSRLVGVSRQTVSRWVKVGLIVPYPDGRFDPREAARRVIGHTDPSRLRAKVLRPLANDVHTLRTEIQAANARADEQRQRADAIQAELDASDKALDRLLDLVMEQRDAIGALVPGDDSEQWLQDLYGRALAETGYGPESAGFDPPGNQAPAADGRHG